MGLTMKISLDILHPAHVHFFKNFIWEMQKHGHDVLVTVAEKDIACLLLNNYGFTYTNHGPYGKSFLQKVLNVPFKFCQLYYTVRRFNPDVYMGLASFRAAQVSFLRRKTSLIFDDTENGRAEVLLYRPFADYICTPSCYKGNLGSKQVRYDGYHELAYLHPDRFSPDPEILKKMNLEAGDKFVIIRFVGWQAVHDIGHAGMTLDTKIKAATEFSRHARIFITSERPLPPVLEPYRITIPPEEIHHVLAYATLLYGESATMASEAAVLGTPAIYLDNVGRGYTDEQEERYGLVFNFTETLEDQERSIQKGVEILSSPDIKTEWQEKRKKLLKDKIDVTGWMIDFVENHATST